MENDMK